MRTIVEPRRLAATVCTLAALVLASCSGGETADDPDAAVEEARDEGPAVHWGYEADNGPAQWGSMNPAWSLCAEGRRQSPIDLSNATEIELPVTEIHMPSDQEVAVLNQAGVLDALDNGHTIQINAKTGEAMTVGDETYALVQFHFHAPSEHTVDGEHFPMEMHFVHQAQDGALAVVGVLIEEGAENPGVASFWGHLANEVGTETAVQIPAEFAQHIFPAGARGAYHYDGSLTTPPCSEGVSWFVQETPTQFSAEQIAAFTAIYDHNNRPAQPLNERTLYLDENPAVTVH